MSSTTISGIFESLLDLLDWIVCIQSILNHAVILVGYFPDISSYLHSELISLIDRSCCEAVKV